MFRRFFVVGSLNTRTLIHLSSNKASYELLNVLSPHSSPRSHSSHGTLIKQEYETAVYPRPSPSAHIPLSSDLPTEVSSQDSSFWALSPIGASSLKLLILLPRASWLFNQEVQHGTWFALGNTTSWSASGTPMFQLRPFSASFHTIPQILYCSELCLTFLTVCPLPLPPSAYNTLVPSFPISHPLSTQFCDLFWKVHPTLIHLIPLLPLNTYWVAFLSKENTSQIFLID